ncbi:MAG: hypothetical protein ACFCGT_16385 [Sandaracinaceae bacterium]
MGKRAERRAARKAAQQERRIAEEQRLKRRAGFLRVVLILPVVVAAIAVGAYLLTNDRRIAGLLGMLGLALWVPALLGLLGAGVKPRDRTRAGSIDFGQRR